MSSNGPTEPLPASSRGATRAEDLRVDPDQPHRRESGHDLSAAATGTQGSKDDRRDPIEMAKQPDNRAKLLLGTAALTLLNLILLLVILGNVTGSSFEQVNVDGAPCVIETGGDESILYCQR
jgi:hypothetical protein